MTEWWSSQMATWIGAVGGGGLGTLSGLLGAAAGVLATRGVGKPFIIGAFGLLSLVGVAGLAAGVVAIIGGQPYHVWYPLLLIGVILTVVTGALTPVILVRYRQAEARRLEAEELRRT